MESTSDPIRPRHKPRVEDDYLVRGAGRFAADVVEPGQAYAVFVRSPHACARIRSLDIDAARRAPGVLAVLTGADMAAAGVGHVARVEVRNQRLVVASMEPRGVTASYDPTNDRTTLRACSQSAGSLRDNILAIMNWPKERLRVVTEDVGGAFGLKTGAYPEYIAVMVGAKLIDRPVHWMSTRSEAFLSDGQARDAFSEGELALDEKGKFLALRIR